MARVVEVGVDAGAFLLGETVTAAEGVVSLEELVPTGEGIVPTVELDGVEPSAFEAAAADDPSVASLERVADDGDRAIYRTEWSGTDGGVLDPITTAEGTVLSGEGRPAGWTFTIRFADGTSVSTFLAECVSAGIDLDVDRVYNADGVAEASASYGLTDRQRTALVAAWERGYFDVPREATQADLAGELDVAPQSVSELVRRATGELVANTVAVRTDRGSDSKGSEGPEGPERSARA